MPAIAAVEGMPHVPPSFPLMTPRLSLRPFQRGDVDAVFAYRQRVDVARYLADGPMSREACADAIVVRANQLSFREENDRIVLAVERQAEGDVIGEIVLIWRNVAARQAELGYVFHPDFAGQGYATEAARRLVNFGFCELGLHRIFARCDPRNIRSFALMERLGMRREAHFREHTLHRGAYVGEYIYAVLEAEWPGEPGHANFS
jgi:RimJ/RimL family protein N-acetyltransferase